MTAAKFISDLVAGGRYCFSAEEAVGALGASEVATRSALRRLRQKGELAMPYKDFLAIQLQGARRYDRIAGFFSSSLLEVAGEALERMKPGDGKAGVITRTDGSCFGHLHRP